MNSSAWLEQLSRTALIYVLAVLLTTTALMYSFIPIWVSAVVLVCIIWRLLIFSGKRSFPSAFIKTPLVFFSMLGALIQFHDSLSLDMFVTILMLGFALKLLELYHKRAAQLLLYIAIFVLMTYLLYQQTLASSLLAFGELLLIMAAIIAVNSDARWLTTVFSQPIKKAVIIGIFALPLTVLIFLVMPRVLPLWVMPLQTQQAKTGMSDTMSPGNITQLTNSNELVFRASFVGNMPSKNEMYWEGFVFDEFDGKQWKNNCECNYTWVNTSRLTPPLPIEKHQWHYQIILEPHGYRWVFALPDSYIQDRNIRTNGDNLFRFSKEVVDRTIYEGNTFTTNTHLSLTKVEEKRYLMLPKQGNPQARELAASWRANYQNNNDIIEQALNLYHTSMTYTLTPPPLGSDSVDDFLFKTKAGFCEHFAGSFVFLMRAAGIPARVVLGYQGGEINEEGNYIIVRQYDAHAWAQVWLPQQGWVRIDPTGAVAPERIEQGFESIFANSPVLNTPLSLNRYRNINIMNWLRIKLDYMDYAWSRWVVGYSSQQQQAVLAALGLTSPEKILLWIAAVFIIFFTGFFVWSTWRNRLYKNESALTIHYRKLSNAYERFGCKRNLFDTPLQFAQQIQFHQLPYAEQFQLISQQYNAWVCGNDMSSKEQTFLKWQCVYWQWRLRLLRWKINNVT